jgi:hypothetical protein
MRQTQRAHAERAWSRWKHMRRSRTENVFSKWRRWSKDRRHLFMADAHAIEWSLYRSIRAWHHYRTRQKHLHDQLQIVVDMMHIHTYISLYVDTTCKRFFPLVYRMVLRHRLSCGTTTHVLKRFALYGTLHGARGSFTMV